MTMMFLLDKKKDWMFCPFIKNVWDILNCMVIKKIQVIGVENIGFKLMLCILFYNAVCMLAWHVAKPGFLPLPVYK